ncbi:ABC transporter permease [Insolitispirillum peregrinum]|uniref:ABC transporter permease n=1 Tax=Insolitispirillum peregrinum TaxID=80876 RepID=UPI0036060126
MDFLLVQALNGLASASSLFLVASGLSLIFGVTRIVNFAHGAFYMLGAYGAYSLYRLLLPLLGTGWGFWLALPLAALAVAVVAALVEILILRRLYDAPELLQLLATFGLTLVTEDLVLMIWGAEDLLGPRAPGLKGAVSLLGQKFPLYDLALIAVGPVVWLALRWWLTRTRWGLLVRAATQDRAMVAALGVNQAWLFTGVFALGVFLAALGGAIQLPRDAVHHGMGLQVIVAVFVVVVIGGLGSISGALLASVLIAELNAFGILLFPRITLVLMFLVMAAVLIVRPSGLLGKPQAPAQAVTPGRPWQPWQPPVRWLLLAAVVLAASAPLWLGDYRLSVASEILIFMLFAASLHLMMGVGGLISFGHAAFFGLGAYGAALSVHWLQAPMGLALLNGPLLAIAGAILLGGFCLRLSGVYLAMLTLAFAQIVWSMLFQGGEWSGGDNGLLGIWPEAWAASPAAFYGLTLAVVVLAILLIRRLALSPFGYAVRGCRDNPLRAEAIGLPRGPLHWACMVFAGAFAGLAGALYAFLKGSVFPDSVAIPLSVDGLVMVMLGGVQSLTGPVLGALVYKGLAMSLISAVEYWRLILGGLIVVLATALPQGLSGIIDLVRRAPSVGPSTEESRP